MSFNIIYVQCRFYNDFLMILTYYDNHYIICLISLTTHCVYKITIFKIYYIHTRPIIVDKFIYHTSIIHIAVNYSEVS